MPIEATDGVRYTVPSLLQTKDLSDPVTLRFRVRERSWDRFVCVYADGRCIYRRKKAALAPGTMEEVKLSPTDLAQPFARLTVKLEDA